MNGLDFHTMSYTDLTCPACNGKGHEVMAGEEFTCEQCGGTGKPPEPVAVIEYEQ